MPKVTQVPQARPSNTFLCPHYLLLEDLPTYFTGDFAIYRPAKPYPDLFRANKWTDPPPLFWVRLMLPGTASFVGWTAEIFNMGIRKPTPLQASTLRSAVRSLTDLSSALTLGRERARGRQGAEKGWLPEMPSFVAVGEYHPLPK